jgi:uncharacterized membrane protein YccC
MTGLGAVTPNPRGFTAIALVGSPIAAVLTGILEFIILNGADAFPLLAIAMAPFTIGAALLMKSQNPLWSSLGRVNLMFIPVMLAPSNPQTYNPQSFLFTSLFLVAGVSLTLAAQTLIPPVSDDERRMRLLAEARRELQKPARQHGGRFANRAISGRWRRAGQSRPRGDALLLRSIGNGPALRGQADAAHRWAACTTGG